MLYQKHRPQTFDEIVGNRSLMTTLKGLLKKKDTPHVFLFVGPTGTGKTTMARIVANELKCSENNLIEIDTAQFTGIDSVRDIRKSSQFTPLGGGVRVFILDECFSKGTQIETPDGKKSIEDIKIGDIVFSLAGKDTVTNTFINKVPLERIIFLKFSNSSSLLCSKDHLFFTKKGWVKACLLQKNSLLLPMVSQSMTNNVKQTNNTSYETQESTILSTLRDKTEQTTKSSMFQRMFQSVERCCKKSTNTNGNTLLSYLWKKYYLVLGQTRQIQQYFLQQQMCGQKQCLAIFRGGEITGNKRININTPEGIFTNKKGKITKESLLSTDVNKQPFIKPKSNSEIKCYKNIEWNIARMDGGSWWKWSFNRTTGIISNFFRLAYGSGYKDRKQPIRWFWLSNLLQSRYRKQEIENSNRSGWGMSQIEESYITRFEENRETEFVRLESATIYEQANNDECFRGIIGDQERDQGFVNFYDLEIKKHPSYFANEITVHNCHSMSKDAQNALLKILEDTPPHIYFILCTTNEKSLLPTIIGRCSRHQVSLLSDVEMFGLVEGVALKEKEILDRTVIEQVVKSAQGHPRNALTILEQVIATPEKRRIKVAEQAQILETESIELARALYNGKKWDTVKGILKNLKASDDAESVRRVVLGYMTSILLNKEDDRCGLILECFQEPFYNSGFPGLVFACYQVIKG